MPATTDEGMADDDLPIVLLCELGERILAVRELLAAPAVAAKPHTHAVAALLARGLDAVEERLQRDVVLPLAGAGSAGTTQGHPRGATVSALRSALHALADGAAALRLLHRRLGLLDLRWQAAPCDIFLRKLREDVGDLPQPAIVLTDDYAAIDEDVAERLCAELRDVGVPASGPRRAAEPVIALPRLEAANPLAWPLLLPALVRLLYDAAHPTEAEGREVSGSYYPWNVDVVGLGGPAAFAALAAHALASTPPTTPAWPALAGLSAAARAYTDALEDVARQDGRAADGPVGLFTRLLQERDRALGHTAAEGRAPQPAGRDDAGVPALPGPRLPSAAETAALLDKLVAGIPINAIAAPLPDDFVARLAAVRDAAGFYDLIAPLGERPASLAAILGVGWLYKVRHSYGLFRDRLHGEETLHRALAAYRPHMVERNELLLQSIEAAYVQGIFRQGEAAR